MKTQLKIFLLTALLLALFSGRQSFAGPDSSGAFYLGKAKTEITPPIGTPLAGYGRLRKKYSAGVHDPLYARALALSKDGETFVFISADLVFIDAKLRAEALKIINRKKLLRDERLVLTATHTHSGTGAIGGRFWQRFIMGKFRKKIFEMTAGKIAEAALAALDTSVLAYAQYGEARIDDKVENRMDEKLNFPDRLRVLRFQDEKGKIAAWMLFMAAHPTLFPASDLLYSADFPGVINRHLENLAPDSVSLFVNGAAGDLRPKTGPFHDRTERMTAYGLTIAEEIKNLSFQEVPLGKGSWKGLFEKRRLPRVRIRLGKVPLPPLIGAGIFPRHSAFQAVRMGRYLFLAFPGELSSEVGYRVEQEAKARGFIPLILGYANDYIAYVVPHNYYLDTRQYESRVSFYGPKMDWFIQRQAIRLAEKLLTENEKKEVFRPGVLLKFRGLTDTHFSSGKAYPFDSQTSVSSQDGLPILKLYGPSYHQGFEEGRLLKKQIHKAVKEIFGYFERELPIPFLNRLLIHAALDQAWQKMEPYLSYSEYLQIRGLARGADIPFRQLKRIHTLPEVYPTWCTNGAYWGKATAQGRLIAIRNLDWNRKIGIQRHAAVKWISTPGRQTYANIGYYGFTGVLSGMNDEGISVGQIGAMSRDETMKGVPMPFLLKRILAEAQSLDDARAIFERSPLTRGYNYVIADAVEKKAVAVETTAHHLAFFEDKDPKEQGVPYAFSIEDAVFRADPALDPQIRDLQLASKGDPKKPGLEMPAGGAYEIRYKKHGELILKNYGKIDPETAQHIALQVAPASNIQSVVYAFPDFWVANAKDDLRAAETEFIHFDFKKLADRN